MIINFTGYDVIARDSETMEVLYMGRVVACDIGTSIIEMHTPENLSLEGRHMNILLYGKGRAYTFNGTYRTVKDLNRFGVALYHGSVKMDRKNERYAIDLKAEIIAHKTKTGNRLPSKVYHIRIKDISKSGMRIEGYDLGMEIRDRISVQFVLNNQTSIYYAQIIRLVNYDENTHLTEYGCELLTLKEYNTKGHLL